MEADVEKVQDQLMATLLPFQVCVFDKFVQRSYSTESHK